MATADQRYAEKIAARASGRVPVFQQQPVAVSATASVHERYLAKLAARAASAGKPASAPVVEAKPEPAADKPPAKEGKANEAKPEPKADSSKK